jgi:hypothetical protein
MQSNNQQGDQLDLLRGAKAIAHFIRCTERQVWYLAEKGCLPVQREGRLLTASKSALRKHYGATEIMPVVAAPPTASEQMPSGEER